MTTSNEEIKFLVIGTILITLLFGSLYYLTTHNYEKEIQVQKGNEEKTINYDEVFYGNYLNKQHDKYYVYLFNNDNEMDIKTIVINYKTKEDSLPMYYGNLSLKMNKDMFDIDKNIEDEALLYIKNGKVNKVYTTNSEIQKELETSF